MNPAQYPIVPCAVIAAIALLPFGRMVEIPMGVLSLIGFALLLQSPRRPSAVLGTLGLAYLAFLLPMLLALLVMGTVGFVAAGTLFGALAARSNNARDLVLSLVVFPLIAPALLGAVVATRDLFAGASLAELLGWIRALAAFDLIFLAAGVALFDPLLAD